MAKIDEVLKEIGNLNTKIGIMDTKIGALDEKVDATKEIVEKLEKNNKEQWATINNNKNRIVKLETKGEVEEKKVNHNFYIWVAIIGGGSAVIASLIIKFI